MAKTTMQIILSEDLEQRLHAAAESKGQSVEEFVQEALYTYVEDMEDGALAYVALQEEGLMFLQAEGASSGALDHSVFEARRKTA